MNDIHKSNKLANVFYDIRGPVLDAAKLNMSDVTNETVVRQWLRRTRRMRTRLNPSGGSDNYGQFECVG